MILLQGALMNDNSTPLAMIPAHEDTEILDSLSDYLDDNNLSPNFTDSNSSEYNEELFHAHCQAISEIGMLLAAAAFSDDEKYTKISRKISFESRKDSAPIKDLRFHFLNHRDELDFPNIAETVGLEFNPEVFEQRIQQFIEYYKLVSQ